MMMGFASLNPSYASLRHQLRSGFLSSSGKYFITLTSGFGAAWRTIFYNPTPACPGPHRDGVEFKPRSTWTLLQSATEEPKLSARILHASGLAAVLPVGVERKLDPLSLPLAAVAVASYGSPRCIWVSAAMKKKLNVAIRRPISRPEGRPDLRA